MNSIYKIDFRKLRQENLRATFESFERAMEKLQIDFYLIGALARDTWFAQKGIRALGTKDIDFAVMISDPEKFHELKQFMVIQEDFVESSVNNYVLIDKSGLTIDLMPFGALEFEGKEIIDSQGLVHTNISGFREVYEAAIRKVHFGDRHKFNVATLAGIVILKFIAYDDRPEMRSEDLKDVGAIIKNFFILERDLIYDNHLDIIDEPDRNKISARVLGRQMKTVLNRKQLLKQRILTILNQIITSVNGNTPVFLWEDESPIDFEYQAQVISQIINGINDNQQYEPLK